MGGGASGEVEKDGKRPQQQEIPSPAEEGLFDTYLIVFLSTALLYLAAWRTRRRRERMLGVRERGA